MKEDAPDRHVRPAALWLDLHCNVRSDRLAFSIRVGGDEYFARILRRALQFRDRLFLSRNRNEFRLEATLDVDAELFLGKVHDVADGCANAIPAAEILADRFRLGGRFDDDERLRSSRRWRKLVLMHLGRDVPATAALSGCRAGRLASRRAGSRAGFTGSHFCQRDDDSYQLSGDSYR